LNRRAGLNSRSPKISVSGVKLTVVPRRLGVLPRLLSGPVGCPRENSCAYSSLLRATSTRTFELSALTTLTPTPWSPPLVA
jgi:hypothetical protein